MFNNSIHKQILKKIKEFDEIVIARHIGPDPDAIASQTALRDIITLNFPIILFNQKPSVFSSLSNKNVQCFFDRKRLIVNLIEDRFTVDREDDPVSKDPGQFGRGTGRNGQNPDSQLKHLLIITHFIMLFMSPVVKKASLRNLFFDHVNVMIFNEFKMKDERVSSWLRRMISESILAHQMLLYI